MTSPPTIAGRVAAMQATRAATPADKVTAAFSREQAELAAGGLQAGLAAAGTVLPDTGLLDPHAAATTLYAVTGGSTTVLVFYRGAWCPYCSIALSACRRTSHQLTNAVPSSSRQSPEAGQVTDHAAEARPGLHGRLRPR